MVKRINFHWERKFGRYKFDPNLRYVMYFKGCFCPPHRGHYSTIADIMRFNPNVRLVINQKGCEHRHGVPARINRMIWQIYINRLLPANRISLGRFNKKEAFINHPFIRSCDRIVIMRGDENFDFIETENKGNKSYRKILDELNKRNIELDCIMSNRSGIYSSSKLVSMLLDYKAGKGNYYKIVEHLPPGLQIFDYNRIINMLLSCDLKV